MVLPKRKEENKIDDLISRQDAIIELVFNEETKDIKCEDMRKVLNVLKKMPSAESRRKGKWIKQDDCWDGIYYECSVCKYSFSSIEGTPSDNDYDFCPSCGSYNGGEDDEID